MHHHNKFRQTTLLFSSLNKPWYFATIVLHTSEKGYNKLMLVYHVKTNFKGVLENEGSEYVH